ncbi:MAG: CRISPR-associated endonuclease Cas2 [Chloroflexota bacterium]
MLTLVVYDIPSDGLRTRVADMCQDYGLQRIQYSAFLGEMSGNHQEELVQRLRRRVGRTPCNIQLFPLSERDARLRKVIHNPDLPPTPAALLNAIDGGAAARARDKRRERLTHD